MKTRTKRTRGHKTCSTLAGVLVAAGLLAVNNAAHIFGERADSWYQRGQEQWQAGQLEEAAGSYQRSIALDPHDGRAYIGLAVLYEAVNRPDLAVEELKRLQLANPAATHLPCRLAEAYLGADDVSEARTLGQQAAQLEPDCPRALSVYGIALVRSRYSASAIPVLRQALSLAPSDSGIAEVLVEACAQQGDYAEAIRIGAPLLKEHGTSARLEYQVGLAYSRLPVTEGNIASAEQHLREADRLTPRWFQPSAELGRMFLALGRRSEAIEAFEAAWKCDQTVPGVAFNLASLYRRSGDPRAAAMERRVAVLSTGGQSVTGMRVQYNQQRPSNDAIIRLARAEAAAGEDGAALHRLRKLLSQNPTNLEALRLYRDLDQNSLRAYPRLPRPGTF